MRLVARMIGALAVVAGSSWVTLTVLRHMETAGAPTTVQTTPSTNNTTTATGQKRGETARRVDFDSFNVNPGCSFSGDTAGRLLTTSSQQYSIAVGAPLLFPPFSVGRGKIRARLQVLQGQLGILAVERIDPTVTIGEKAVDVTAAPVLVEVDLPDVTKAGQVVLKNLSPNGTTRARILSIESVVL
jgi:hypothetical protein